MPFKKGLNKYLKYIVYKYSPTSKLVKNSRYILYSYILVPARRDNSFKPIIIPKIIKDI